MAIRFWKSLPIKTGVAIAVASFILMVLLSYALYSYGKTQVMEESRHRIEQAVKTTQTTAAIAAFVRDKALAEEIINGLVHNDVISGVILKSVSDESDAEANDDALENGEADASNPDAMEETNAEEELMVTSGETFHPGDTGTETFKLDSPFFDGTAGILFIKSDQNFIQALARKNAQESVMVLAFVIVLITLLTIILVNQLLAQPLSRLANALHKIEVGSDQRLSCPDTHKNDEIGQLINDGNRLLESVQQTLDGERRLRGYVEALQQKTREEAERDPLTRLLNRKAGERELDKAVSDSIANSTECIVMLIDLDAFKPINDEYGHDAGDLALVTIAQRLLNALRHNDSVVRWGGDEFLLIIRQDNDILDTVGIAKKVLERISAPIELVENVHKRIYASIGIAMAPLHATSRSALIEITDKAMYHSKATGKNGFYIHGSDADADNT